MLQMSKEELSLCIFGIFCLIYVGVSLVIDIRNRKSIQDAQSQMLNDVMDFAFSEKKGTEDE